MIHANAMYFTGIAIGVVFGGGLGFAIGHVRGTVVTCRRFRQAMKAEHDAMMEFFHALAKVTPHAHSQAHGDRPAIDPGEATALARRWHTRDRGR